MASIANTKYNLCKSGALVVPDGVLIRDVIATPYDVAFGFMRKWDFAKLPVTAATRDVGSTYTQSVLRGALAANDHCILIGANVDNADCIRSTTGSGVLLWDSGGNGAANDEFGILNSGWGANGAYAESPVFRAEKSPFIEAVIERPSSAAVNFSVFVTLAGMATPTAQPTTLKANSGTLDTAVGVEFKVGSVDTDVSVLFHSKSGGTTIDNGASVSGATYFWNKGSRVRVRVALDYARRPMLFINGALAFRSTGTIATGKAAVPGVCLFMNNTSGTPAAVEVRNVMVGMRN